MSVTFTLILLPLLGAAAVATVVPYLDGDPLFISSTADPSTTTTTITTIGTSSSAIPQIVEEGETPSMISQAEESLLQPPPPPPPAASEISPVSVVDDGLRRRVITYDQRQEGQYNIRADLENFMILLIPPGPQEGLNLLDMLTKSSLRNKAKRKHYAKGSPVSLKSYFQRQQQLQQPQLHQNRQQSHRLHQQQQQQQHQQQQHQQLSVLGNDGSSSGSPLSDFIEGRTPYHVDISASDDEQARLHPERQQVDVLPPPYFPQLIKPFHLEAEPTIIQTLPPAEINSGSSSGSAAAAGGSSTVVGLSNLLDGYHQSTGAQYYRNSRALRGDTYLDTNRLSGNSESSGTGTARSISAPIYRTDLSATANSLGNYPPIDVPAYVLADAQARSWRLDDEPTPVVAAAQPKQLLHTDIFSFDLLGDTLADSKLLLRDGLARCAPGQRRDSYGACREIEGY